MNTKKYGYCPFCCGEVFMTDRGKHQCTSGHVYPREQTTKEPQFVIATRQAIQSIETAMASDAPRTRAELDNLAEWCEAIAQTARQMELRA